MSRDEGTPGEVQEIEMLDLRYGVVGFPVPQYGIDQSGFEMPIWDKQRGDDADVKQSGKVDISTKEEADQQDRAGRPDDEAAALEQWRRTVREEKAQEAEHPERPADEVERAAAQKLVVQAKQSKKQAQKRVELTSENAMAVNWLPDTLVRHWLHHRDGRWAITQRGLNFMRAIGLMFRFKDLAGDTSFAKLESRIDAEADVKQFGGMAQLLEMGVEAGYLKRVKRGGNEGFAATSGAFLTFRKPIPLGQRSPTLDRELSKNYEKLRPTTQSEKDRRQIVATLQSHFHRHLPEAGFVVELFGSSGSGLYSPASDSDICCYHGVYPPSRRVGIWDVKRALDRSRDFTDLIAISHAKIPIVKMRHIATDLAVDVSIENTIAIENTRLLRLYAECDARVKPLLFALKTWCKSRAVAHPEQGSLSSYSWVLLMLHYLQRTHPPVIPNMQYQGRVQTFVHAADAKVIKAHYEPAVCERWQSQNTAPLGELLHGFYKYFHEYDWARKVVDIRGRVVEDPEGVPHPTSPYYLPETRGNATPGLLTRDIKVAQYGERDWHRDNKVIAIQDPFIDERNTAVGCWEGHAVWIQDEISRAYRLLSAGGTFGDIVYFNKQ